MIPRHVAVFLLALVGSGCAAILSIEDIEKKEDGGPPCDPALASPTDPKNCGRCGRDCLGAECEAGQCKPVTLASVSESISWAVLGPNHVYYLASTGTSTGTSSTLMRVRYSAGAQPETVLSLDGSFGLLANNATHLYWVGSNGSNGNARIMRLPLAGGEPETVFEITPSVLPKFNISDLDVSPDGTTIYLLGTQSSTSTSGMSSATEQLVSVRGGTIDAQSTGLSSSSSENGSSMFGANDKQSYLMRDVSDTGLEVSTYTHGSRPQSLLQLPRSSNLSYSNFLLAGENVVWLETRSTTTSTTSSGSSTTTQSKIQTLAPSSTAPALIDSPQGSIYNSILTDRTHVYFVMSGQTSYDVRRVPVAGGSEEVLASDQRKARLLAIDKVRIVWSSSTNALVMLAK